MKICLKSLFFLCDPVQTFRASEVPELCSTRSPLPVATLTQDRQAPRNPLPLMSKPHTPLILDIPHAI